MTEYVCWKYQVSYYAGGLPKQLYYWTSCDTQIRYYIILTAWDSGYAELSNEVDDT